MQANSNQGKNNDVNEIVPVEIIWKEQCENSSDDGRTYECYLKIDDVELNHKEFCDYLNRKLVYLENEIIYCIESEKFGVFKLLLQEIACLFDMIKYVDSEARVNFYFCFEEIVSRILFCILRNYNEEQLCTLMDMIEYYNFNKRDIIEYNDKNYSFTSSMSEISISNECMNIEIFLKIIKFFEIDEESVNGVVCWQMYKCIGCENKCCTELVKNFNVTKKILVSHEYENSDIKKMCKKFKLF